MGFYIRADMWSLAPSSVKKKNLIPCAGHFIHGNDSSKDVLLVNKPSQKTFSQRKRKRQEAYTLHDLDIK